MFISVDLFMISPSDPSEAMEAITPAPRGSMPLALVMHLGALAGRQMLDDGTIRT